MNLLGSHTFFSIVLMEKAQGEAACEDNMQEVRLNMNIFNVFSCCYNDSLKGGKYSALKMSANM